MLTVAEAATRLGVSRHEVRRLVHDGTLEASRVGRVLFVDERGVNERAAAGVGQGRALAPVNAWAVLLELAVYDDPDTRESVGAAGRIEVADSTRTRLFGDWLDRQDSAALARACRRRARAHHVRVLPAYRDRVLADPAVTASGLSAATTVGADILSPATDHVEVYCSVATFERLTSELGLTTRGAANLIVRVPDLPHDSLALAVVLDRRVMPATVVGADLAESADIRTRRAGLALLTTALQARLSTRERSRAMQPAARMPSRTPSRSP